MADDLDDEWWLQSSETENHEPQDSNSESDSANENVKIKGKVTKDKERRKRKKSINEAEDENIEEEDSSVTKNNKKKKRKRKRITEELKEKLPDTTKCEHLLQAVDKFFKDKLSSVEQDEINLDEDKDFCVCSSPEDTATSYLRTILPKWKKLTTKSELPPGSPLLLIITSSAIRAVQLNREIQDFKGEEAKCAKLFAKHFKLEEQKRYLAKQICHMGIGTPNRLQALLKDNSLNLKNLKTIVVDWNWRDIKSKRLIDIPEIKKDFMSLLQTYIIPHVHNTKCKIGLL